MYQILQESQVVVLKSAVNYPLTAGEDYAMTVTTVNFGSGQNVTTVTISLMGDSVYEGSEFETFTVGLRATGMGEVNIGDVGMVTVRLTENDGKNLMCTYASFLLAGWCL